MASFWLLWLENRKLLRDKRGDIELDQLGKLVIALVFLLVLIFIVTIIIGGEFGNQEDEIEGVFSILN